MLLEEALEQAKVECEKHQVPMQVVLDNLGENTPDQNYEYGTDALNVRLYRNYRIVDTVYPKG